MTFRKSLPTSRVLATFALAGSLVVTASVIAQTTTPTATPGVAQAPPVAPSRPSGPSPGDGHAATADQLFTSWDKDKNTMLSLDEFKNGWESAREQNILGRLEAQFRAADKDKSGLIETAEFSNLPLVKRAGSGAPPMSAFDANKDQRIDFKEYLDLVPAMMKRIAPASK